jgi:hypothetical protein
MMLTFDYVCARELSLRLINPAETKKSITKSVYIILL